MKAALKTGLEKGDPIEVKWFYNISPEVKKSEKKAAAPKKKAAAAPKKKPSAKIKTKQRLL